MGRLLQRRYEIKGLLIAETPIHVGGGNDDLMIDMPLAVDGDGCFFLPGTSLTGPIRSWWARVFSEQQAELVFGRRALTATDEGHASVVFVHDARLSPRGNNGVHQEIRQGVGIDRQSGAAADNIKYDRAILPKGATFDFSMVIEIPAASSARRTEDDGARGRGGRRAGPLTELLNMGESLPRRFGALLKALEAGTIRFGGAKTRGLGRLKLVDVKVLENDIGTFDGTLAVLKGGKPIDRHDDWIGKAENIALDSLEIRIRWRPTLPVMSKSGVDGFLVDFLPLVTSDGACLRPVIPGSSIKGVLRSHAERIWRTVAGVDAPDDEEDDVFARQLSGVDPTDPSKPANLADILFGSVATSTDKSNTNKPFATIKNELLDDNGRPGALPGLGAVAVDDCVIGPAIDQESWNSILSATCADDPIRLRTARDLLRNSGWDNFALPVAHAAIDRWTGGAADKSLFAGLEVKAPGPWELTLFIDPSRIACPRSRTEPRRKPDAKASATEWEAHQIRVAERRRIKGVALALLVLTLRDFAKRRIPIGFGVNRGLGSVEVESITVTGGISDLLAPVSEHVLTPEDFENTGKMAKFEQLDEAWRDYCSAHRSQPAAAEAAS